MESGHYISYVQSEDKKWYVINDAEVRPIPVTEVVNSNAYMLFYIRKDVKNESYQNLFKTIAESVEEEANDKESNNKKNNKDDKKKCTII